ncbi:hypothetical protein [Achromobacter insuavis]|uniref:hypothetical protein n=1 Tax=Achromobacter insuavis TaxID=1287735 RepID=UPI001F137314|nr:hypothetical protein [Achromobacter insuavis]
MTTSNNTIQAADKEIHEEFERRYAMDADDPASAIELGHFVDGWRACISRQRTLAMGSPFMYGIAAPDGTAYIEEFCVSGDRGELQTEVVDQLNRDSLEGSYSVVGLFRDEPPVAQPKMRDALSGMVALFARGTPPGESPTVDLARSVLAGADPRHADDIAVDQFATAMKAKLAKKRAEGRGGWNDKSQCSAGHLSQLLRGHVDKGDPVDVGNLAMMLQQRGEAIAPAEDDERDTAALQRLCDTLSKIVHNMVVAEQAAWIEWQHGEGAEAGMRWIGNGLAGPGHIPNEAEPYAKEAQAWYDANKADPFPTCYCGRPSNILHLGKGYCSTEHHNAATAYEQIKEGSHE